VEGKETAVLVEAVMDRDIMVCIDKIKEVVVLETIDRCCPGNPLPGTGLPHCVMVGLAVVVTIGMMIGVATNAREGEEATIEAGGDKTWR
jgi:hypothetical protein